MTTDALYDQFTAGFVEARAIQAGIRHAASESGALRFVLLIGDDTFDNNDFLGTGAMSFVPSLLYFDGVTGEFPRRTSSPTSTTMACPIWRSDDCRSKLPSRLRLWRRRS